MARPAIRKILRLQIDILALLHSHRRMTLLAGHGQVLADQWIPRVRMIERRNDLPPFRTVTRLAGLVNKSGTMWGEMAWFAVTEILR